MVQRTFHSFDNDSLLIDGDPGSPIINNSSMPNGTVYSFVGGLGGEVTVDDQSGNGSDTEIFEDDITSRHSIVDGSGLVANGTQVEAESIVELRALDANGDPTGAVITLTVFSQGGVTGDVWGFASDSPLNAGVDYIKVGGSNIGSSRYDSFMACFGLGTQIRSHNGTVSVQSIQKGDLVWTLSSGLKPVRWVGHNRVPADGSLAPVQFAAGAIGNDRDLQVSPNHRMLVQGWQVQLLFGEDSVLVPAKHLVGLPGVSICPAVCVDYLHIMFDRHEIIEADGVLSESFYPGQVAMAGVEQQTRDEVLQVFPELGPASTGFGSLASPCLSRPESLVLNKALSLAA